MGSRSTKQSKTGSKLRAVNSALIGFVIGRGDLLRAYSNSARWLAYGAEISLPKVVVILTRPPISALCHLTSCWASWPLLLDWHGVDVIEWHNLYYVLYIKPDTIVVGIRSMKNGTYHSSHDPVSYKYPSISGNGTHVEKHTHIHLRFLNHF